MDISQTQLIKELRCLRIHLAPLVNEHTMDILKAVERRLTPGAVSTTPVQTPNKRRNVITHQNRVNKYLHK